MFVDALGVVWVIFLPSLSACLCLMSFGLLVVMPDFMVLAGIWVCGFLES